MRKPVFIGEKCYQTKKAALLHYKTILNSYNFGESLSENDFNDIIDLLEFEPEKTQEEQIEVQQTEILFPNEFENFFELEIIDVKVSKVQFNTKCFEVFFNDDESIYISYIMIINNTKDSSEKNFKKACRNVIQEDLRRVKQDYFNANSIKGLVKCQESGKHSKWEDLVIDHRQPNTLSVIIDRFLEISKIEINEIEFESSSDNLLVFKDKAISESFREYHKNKANLRIVRKDLNVSRSSLARVKQSPRDLKIE